MVLPISGPYGTSKTFKGPANQFGFRPDWGSIVRSSLVQRRPYNLPLAYTTTTIWILTSANSYQYTQSVSDVPQFPSYGDVQRLYNKVYADFMSDVQVVKAEMGSTFGEWKQAESMITKRANQLISGLRAARRGDLSGLKRAWGKRAGFVPSKRGYTDKRNKQSHDRATARDELRFDKAVASNVLEYSFGWAPLVADISKAVAVLSKGIPPPYVKRRGSVSLYGSTGWLNLGSVYKKTNMRTSYKWELRAVIRTTNPNLALAQSLGLVNLGTVLWEVTPWSFVVDYFANVNDFIASWTDLVGLTLENPNKTLVATMEVNVSAKFSVSPPALPPSWAPPSWHGRRFQLTRSTGLPGPTLDLRLPWRLSLQRASTSIALLLQLLPSKR